MLQAHSAEDFSAGRESKSDLINRDNLSRRELPETGAGTAGTPVVRFPCRSLLTPSYLVGLQS
jgi:hypothetical protein